MPQNTRGVFHHSDICRDIRIVAALGDGRFVRMCGSLIGLPDIKVLSKPPVRLAGIEAM